MWQKWMWLAIAGALGTLARYGLGGLAQQLGRGEFPWGTLTVNVAGCLLFGVVWTAAEERGLLSPYARSMVLIGFMGAFTTFSTYMFETQQMLRDGEWLWAALNFTANNLLGWLGLWGGMVLGRFL